MVVNSLYYNSPQPFKAEQTTISISDEVLTAALQSIYSQNPNPTTPTIEPHLFAAISKTLISALKEPQFPAVSLLGIDPILPALRHSIDVFSAFKVHRAQSDMAARLLDSNGNLKPFEQWKAEVLPIASHQCGTWLETEYNTAVLRARQTAQWQQFLAEKDVLPNLKWLPSTSPNPGADHRLYWNTILPIDHPFWDQHRPGDRWNCKCSLTSTDESPTPVPSEEEPPSPTVSPSGNNPHPGLAGNPAKTRAIFSQDHPYFPKDCNHCAFYKPNVKSRLRSLFKAQTKDCYNCPYIDGCINEADGEMIKFSRNAVRKDYKDKDIIVHPNHGPNYEILVTYQAIKSVTGKPHKFAYLRNVACYNMKEVMSNSEYLGWSPEIKNKTSKGHGVAENWHYYRIIVGNEDSFISVQEKKEGEMLLHAIQDADHFKRDKIQNPWRKR